MPSARRSARAPRRDDATESRDAKSTAVTLTNCDREVSYDKVPERVVTNDVGITERSPGPAEST
ncbi:hypothetical protein GCM10010335_59660 [Streptomyces galbus]|nr:hypothetical protein GCM10010335_59660 [Streptomyces galbus]